MAEPLERFLFACPVRAHQEVLRGVQHSSVPGQVARGSEGPSVSFRDMTTRRHYPGRHRIDLIINGHNYALAEFAVRR
jgi:hypothetical protein